MPTLNRNFKVKNSLEVVGTVSASGLAGTLLSGTSPGMDGSASAGTSTVPARADHVHPTDTSRAPLASPTFTGTPAAPTAAADTNSTQVATTGFVVGQAASTSPVMDGIAAVGTSLRYARADHVHASDTSRAPLASPALTGTPTAPTASANTSTTQIATTAFVLGQANSNSATIAVNGTQAAGSSNLYARADHVHGTDTSRAPVASPSFTGTVTLPTGAGYVKSSPSGVVSASASIPQSDVSDLVGDLGARVNRVNGTVATAAVNQNVVRNITLSTSEPTAGSGSAGDVWFRYV